MKTSHNPGTRAGLWKTRMAPRIWIALLFPPAVLAVVFLFFRPYSTSDDVCIKLMLNGIGDKGVPGEMLVYLNILLGLFLKELFFLAPGFPWFEALLYGVLLASAWSLFYSLLPEKAGFFPGVVVVGVLFLLFFRFFLHPQWTSVAFVSGAAGIIALAAKLRDPKKASGFLFPAGLMFLSFLLRAEAFFGMLLAALPFLAYRFIVRKPDLKKAAHFFLKLGLAVLAAGVFHWAYYRASPGWPGIYSRFAHLSGVVENRLVARTPDVERCLESQGLDWTDYQMMHNWLTFDPKFDSGKIKALDHALPPPNRGKGTGWLAVFQMQYVQVLMLAAALCMIGLSNPRRWILLLQFAWVLALLAGLFYFARLPGDHVAIPVVSFAALAGLFFFSEPAAVKTKPSNRFFRTAGWIGFAFWAMAVIPLLGYEWKQNRFFREVEAALSQSLQALKPTPDQLYVVSTMGFPFEATAAFGDKILNRHFSLYLLGWNQTTPWAAETLGRFGINNLIRDSVGRKDVFFIFPDYLWAIYLDFARKNYGLQLKPVRVFEGTFFQVNRVESAKEK